MRIAVAGATGRIGALTATALERGGDDLARISRSLGVDLLTGDGPDGALAGVEAVVDATNVTATDPDAVVAYFGAITRNLLAAEHRAGVRHHVLLSIVGIHRVEGNAHYAGTREQERLVEAGPVPWTIVPAARFHDFAAMVTSWTERDGLATAEESDGLTSLCRFPLTRMSFAADIHVSLSLTSSCRCTPPPVVAHLPRLARARRPESSFCQVTGASPPRPCDSYRAPGPSRESGVCQVDLCW